MTPTIDVRNEVRKLADSKPVHAAAGVGVLASQTLRELPGRIVDLHLESAVITLPARATEYVLTVTTKAMDEYDRLARRGRQALSGPAATAAKSELNGKATRSSGTRTGSRSTGSRSTKSSSK